MTRFQIPRIAHCNQGHAVALGMTENCLPGAGVTRGRVARPGAVLRKIIAWENDRRDTVMAKDPVCRMQVDEKKSAVTSVYQGATYYFCAAACKATFEKAPEKFIGKATR